MTHPLDQSIAELLNASRDDEELLSFPINDRSFGFHAQQAVEKLLKALIGAHQVKYRYTHDIASLLMDAVALQENLPVPASVLEGLTEYAGAWRYQEPQAIPPLRRSELRHTITLLRTFCLERLTVLRCDADWSQFV